MAFSPTPENSMPTPDEVLAQLQPEPTDPDQTKGYITPDDIEFGWRVFLSRLAHHDDALATAESWRQTILGRVHALENAQTAPADAFALVVSSENALPTATAQGDLLLALDTGQWFVSNGATWDRLGLDITAVQGNVTAALDRTDNLDGIIDAMVGDQDVTDYSGSQPYQAGDVVLHQGEMWLANAPSTGVAPTTGASEWSLLTLPDLLSKVKQALSQGAQAGNMPVPQDPADDGKVLTAQHGAGVWETLAAASLPQMLGNRQHPAWDPSSAYSKFDVVEHNGIFWIAGNADTQPGEEPGVDPKWFPLTLPDLFQRTKRWRIDAPDDPADNGKVLVAQDGDAHWVPAPSGGGGATVTILEPLGDPTLSPTSTGGDAPTNLPQSPSVGDIVLNATAGTAWVWGEGHSGSDEWLSFQRPYVFAIMGDPKAVAPADGADPVVLDGGGWMMPANTDQVSLWSGELLINVESGAMWVLDGDSWTWEPVGGVGGVNIKMVTEEWGLPDPATVPDGTVYVVRETGQLLEAVSARSSLDTYTWKGDRAYTADDSDIHSGDVYSVSGLAADGASETLAVSKRGDYYGVDSPDLLDGVGVGDVIWVEDDAGNKYGGAVTAVEDPGDQGSWPAFRAWTVDGSASTGTIPADAKVRLYVDGADWVPLTQDWMAPRPTREDGQQGAVLTATGDGTAAWHHQGDPVYSMLDWEAFDPQDTTAAPPTSADRAGYIGIDGKTLSAATVLRVSTLSKDGQTFDVTGELKPGTVVTITPTGSSTYLGQCGTFQVSYRVNGSPTRVTGTSHLVDVPVEPYTITYWGGDFAGRFRETLVKTLCYQSVLLHVGTAEEVPDPPLTQLRPAAVGRHRYVFTSGAAYGPGEVWMQYHKADTPGSGDVGIVWETAQSGVSRVLYVDDAQDANGKADYFRDHLTDGYWYKVTNTLDTAERQVVSVLDSSTGRATPPQFVLGDKGWIELTTAPPSSVGHETSAWAGYDAIARYDSASSAWLYSSLSGGAVDMHEAKADGSAWKVVLDPTGLAAVGDKTAEMTLEPDPAWWTDDPADPGVHDTLNGKLVDASGGAALTVQDVVDAAQGHDGAYVYVNNGTFPYSQGDDVKVSLLDADQVTLHPGDVHHVEEVHDVDIQKGDDTHHTVDLSAVQPGDVIIFHDPYGLLGDGLPVQDGNGQNLVDTAGHDLNVDVDLLAERAYPTQADVTTLDVPLLTSTGKDGEVLRDVNGALVWKRQAPNHLVMADRDSTTPPLFRDADDSGIDTLMANPGAFYLVGPSMRTAGKIVIGHDVYGRTVDDLFLYLAEGDLIEITYDTSAAQYMGICVVDSYLYEVVDNAAPKQKRDGTNEAPIRFVSSPTRGPADFAGRFGETLVRQLCAAPWRIAVFRPWDWDRDAFPVAGTLRLDEFVATADHLIVESSDNSRALGTPGTYWAQWNPNDDDLSAADGAGAGQTFTAQVGLGKQTLGAHRLQVDSGGTGDPTEFSALTNGKWYQITVPDPAFHFTRAREIVLDSSTEADNPPAAQADGPTIVTLTDAEYQALQTKDPDTLYVVKG